MGGLSKNCFEPFSVKNAMKYSLISLFLILGFNSRSIAQTSEIKKLHKEQFETAQDGLKSIVALVEINGRVLPTAILPWARRVLHAQLALSETPAAKKVAYEEYRKQTKKIEGATAVHFKKGLGSQRIDLLVARYHLLEAEIWLAQETNPKANPGLAKKRLEVALDGLKVVEKLIESVPDPKQGALDPWGPLYLPWARSVLEAELFLIGKDREKVTAAYKAYLEKIKEKERIAKKRVDTGVTIPLSFLECAFARLEAEILLRKEIDAKTDMNLAKERLKVAEEAVRIVELRIEGGIGHPFEGGYSPWHYRLLESRLGLDSNKAKRIAACKAYWEKTNEREKWAKVRLDRGQLNPPSVFLEARFDRLEAEIWLLEAKTK